MIAYAQALELLLAEAAVLPAEWCRSADACGRILAEPLRASNMLPPFDNAAMDGYAFATSSEGLAAGSEHRVAGQLAAGAPPPPDAAGDVWEIATGAALPAGLDCIVPFERVERLSAERIRLREAAFAGQNIRRAGSDIAIAGEVAAAGQRIDPALRMVLAALGVERISVRRKPRVALLSTGAELVVDALLPLGPGQIYASNASYLEASLRALGAEVIANVALGDDAQAFAAQTGRLADQADLVLSTGAVSMGSRDFIPAGLQAMGARLLFHKAAIRPGKPILAARLQEGALFVGLPGNPIAVAVGLRYFVVPLLRAMLGMPAETPLRASLAAPIRVAKGLRHFLKARLRQSSDSGLVAELLEGQQSYRMGSLLQANAWVVLPEDADEWPAGALVDALPRDADGGWFVV
ncbi:molybdopterin molybdotransferase MoeA [Pseudoxanthomonas sp. CF125]|uniref:molybdopterin molybdotransferase MoeA n=1 Tax=Pseudoxanthomonas sp. CF125 TaxID=1855303 RepID=UPI00087E09B5|nr:molybdopterin molybdotransferase MoeA [Pseudoxanthomonas sp. CF125]SDQ93073.1 molybdopterin molybdotransferase [Pseudoxanthomonas sp. CF125]